MPHIEKVEIDGKRIPSVNEITGSLSAEGLLQWYRRIGFKKADQITKEARERGIEIGKMFEDVLKKRKVEKSLVKKWEPFYNNFNRWAEKIPNKDAVTVEPHLINLEDLYHGSPDLVADFGHGLEMVDYKVKERAFDYKILMNEAAYCEAWRVQHKVEIKTVRLVNFHPLTGKIHEDVLDYNHKWLQDFFTCHNMWKVNQEAQAYWQKHCKTKLEG